jgi:hypothetical protein
VPDAPVEVLREGAKRAIALVVGMLGTLPDVVVDRDLPVPGIADEGELEKGAEGRRRQSRRDPLRLGVAIAVLEKLDQLGLGKPAENGDASAP